MKKNLLFGFIFAFICWVVVIGVYKFVDQKPARAKEAPATTESSEEENISFEQYSEAATPHLAELGYPAPRNPATESSQWSEATSGSFFPAITDARVLMLLEEKGFRLQDLLLGKKSMVTNNAEFYQKQPLYKDFTDLTTEDINASINEENKYRPDWGKVGTGFEAKRRNLDPRWLQSVMANYELVGVINRMDRVVFEPDTCGELRFIYRLHYKSPKIESRLPLTVNLVYWLARGSDPQCRDLLSQWKTPANLDRQAFASWLTDGGPLRANNVVPANIKALETNYQSIRSSAGVRNMLGGSAEYVLRVFHIVNGRLNRAYLENTPDLARLTQDTGLRSELLSFLKDPSNFDLLDRGVLKIPEKFLTQKMSSFAPHGIARMENRPFDRIFKESDFADMDFSQRRYVRTAGTVLRRLNDLSCVGCHQNRTIAGFHFLGQDRPGTSQLNSIFFAGSGHFRAELTRRQNFLQDLDAGHTPSGDRPFSIAPTSGKAKYGDFCGLPNSQAFSDWVCEDGLSCQLIDAADGEKELGKCFPKVHLSGDPCLQNFVIQNHHSLDKMVQPWTELGCNNGDKDYTCQPPGNGFPSGMCTTTCAHIQGQGEICGPIAGPGFSNCIVQAKNTFNQCLEQTKATASRGRCNNNRSCRNDYVCARINDEEGACLPSYFLFQIRVDGHPVPQ